MENFEYDKKLILLAFEQCENPTDLNTVATWCTNNLDIFSYGEYGEEKEGDEEEEEEEEEELFELIEQENFWTLDNRDYNFEEDAGIAPGFNQLEMETTEKHGTVDMNHPVVKDLLQLDFSLKECFEAARWFPNDRHAAFLYLMQHQGQRDMFGAVDGSEKDDVGTSRQPDVEDHVATVGVRYMHAGMFTCICFD